MREDFDLASGELGVHGSFRARPDQPGHTDDEFVAQLLRAGESLSPIGIADDLDEPFAVAQVDEYHASVVAPSMHPAADGDRLAQAFPVDAAAVVGALHVRIAPPSRRGGGAGTRLINFVGRVQWLARLAQPACWPVARRAASGPPRPSR